MRERERREYMWSTLVTYLYLGFGGDQSWCMCYKSGLGELKGINKEYIKEKDMHIISIHTMWKRHILM